MSHTGKTKLPSGVVLPKRKVESVRLGYRALGTIEGWNACLDEVARLNSSPVSSAPSHGGGVAHTDCRSEDGITVGLIDSIITSCRVLSSRDLTCEAAVEALRDLRSDSDVSLIKPNHSEQVREVVPAGWKLVPVEPTPEMLAAGDKYIGTPATYKAMLSACPSPAITKDFSQFLSAVMDAAGLIRHGRQSKELSEYLGMKCMEYMLSATHPADQVAEPDAELVRQCIAQELATWEGDFKGPVHTAMRCLQVRIDAKMASLKGVEE